MADPRVLVIMGSGETAPTMAKVHRTLFERLGPGPIPAVILDTPYGFQENADDLSARTVRFFADRLGREVEIASFRHRDVDALTAATAVARLRAARYVMAGPGSPSYALRHWLDGPIPAVLAERLRSGGIVTMASAAALTIGAATIPIYEIYKVGEEPYWLPGLDLLGPAVGLKAAIVPHYDNAEGGNHDTRFCYMGERRLRTLESRLPDGTFVLGVDGHTALIMDLQARTAAVAGRGGVTVRAGGASAVFPSGSVVDIDALAEVAERLARGRPVDIGWDPSPAIVTSDEGSSPATMPKGGRGAASSSTRLAAAQRIGPLHLAVADLEGSFLDALGRDDRRAAVAALLDLDRAIEGRTHFGENSPELDNARSIFHALIVRLGDAQPAPDARADEAFDRLVDELVALRDHARDAGEWAASDMIRTALGTAGIEIRDEAAGTRRVTPPEMR